MHVLLFDIDGTLISSGGAGQGALELAFSQAFAIRDLHSVPISGRTDRSIVGDLFRWHGIENSPDNWGRFREAYLGHLPGQLVTRRGRILRGVRELLLELRGRADIALGLLTGNLEAGAAIKLSHFGLSEHFAFGGYGDDHLDRNDVAHMAFQAAHRHTGSRIRPGRTWVIGDTPLDIRCARWIGVRVAAVATGIHGRDELAASEPDLLFDDLSDPSSLLRALDSV